MGKREAVMIRDEIFSLVDVSVLPAASDELPAGVHATWPSEVHQLWDHSWADAAQHQTGQKYRRVIPGAFEKFHLSVTHQEHVDDFILSLLLHSSGEPIRMVVITDNYSLQGLSIILPNSSPTTDVNTLLVKSKSKVLTKGVVLSMRDRNFVIPRLTLVFVNIEKMIDNEEKFIQEMKSNAEEGLEVSQWLCTTKTLQIL